MGNDSCGESRHRGINTANFYSWEPTKVHQPLVLSSASQSLRRIQRNLQLLLQTCYLSGEQGPLSLGLRGPSLGCLQDSINPQGHTLTLASPQSFSCSQDPISRSGTPSRNPELLNLSLIPPPLHFSRMIHPGSVP